MFSVILIRVGSYPCSAVTNAVNDDGGVVDDDGGVVAVAVTVVAVAVVAVAPVPAAVMHIIGFQQQRQHWQLFQ